jgi:carboxyl-terminal processing protease
MRNAIKWFVTGTVVASAFVGGFNADAMKLSRQNFGAARWQMQTTPPVLLSRLLGPSAAHAQDTELVPTDTYVQTLGIIKDNYYNPAGGEKPDSTKLTYAAIDGMLAAIGDRYTEFWTPKEYKDNMQETTGNFVGIGARLDVTKDKKVIIVEPIENSPAIRAGILPGDIIIAVDGKNIYGQPLQKVIDQIRGPEGTQVKITIERKSKPTVYTLRRAVVHTPVVESWMEDSPNKVGYISLAMFNEQSDIQFDAALQKLEAQGMKALVFDLRNNPGGLLTVAQDLASRFIPNGPIVWVKEKSGRMTALQVEANKHRGKLSTGAYPTIVLVNGNSASASEIVSGALQDSGAAYLLGNRTYGKGLVQTIIPLADDSAVKITTQHYFTRDKHDINIKRDVDGTAQSNTGGVHPDIFVDFTEKDYEAQREVLRTDPQNRAGARKLDPQLRRAVAVLKDKIAGKPFPPSEKDKPDPKEEIKPATE